MPYSLELWGNNRAIVINSKTGHHFSANPLPKKRAESQLRLLRMIEQKPEYKRRKK